jgi:molecular chaperone DnaK
MAGDNRSLGRFNLTGIAPAPRGLPQIEVTFDIDRNGILNVSAKDKATGKEQSIRIEGSGGLSKEEIERMKNEAQQHAADDLKKAELVTTRNTAEHAAYQIEQQLKEHGDKIPADARGNVESAINRVREAAKGDDADAIKKAMESLNTEAQAIGKVVYEEAAKQQAAAAGAQPGAAPPSEEGKGDDDVIDAEFEVKDAK